MYIEKHIAKLKTLYPFLSDTDLLFAKDILDRYLLLAWEIYEELERRDSDASLTPSLPSSSIEVKVDSPTNH